MRKKIVVGCTIVILTMIVSLHFSNKNYYYKTLWYNLPGIFDEDIFHSRNEYKEISVNPMKIREKQEEKNNR